MAQTSRFRLKLEHAWVVFDKWGRWFIIFWRNRRKDENSVYDQFKEKTIDRNFQENNSRPSEFHKHIILGNHRFIDMYNKFRWKFWIKKSGQDNGRNHENALSWRIFFYNITTKKFFQIFFCCKFTLVKYSDCTIHRKRTHCSGIILLCQRTFNFHSIALDLYNSMR